MDIVGAMLKYMEVKDKRILVKNIQISDYELTVVVKILSWLKLEHKRSIWISQGKRNRFKPLEIDMRYPWCAKQEKKLIKIIIRKSVHNLQKALHFVDVLQQVLEYTKSCNLPVCWE